MRNGDELKFYTAEDFPVVTGNKVYLGHHFGDSKTQHTVTAVNYISGEITMTSEGFDIPQDTIVIGFANDNVYNAVLNADAVSRSITSMASFIQNSAMDVVHAAIQQKIGDVENAFNNFRSLRNIDISPSTAYGVHVLKESEMGVPFAGAIDSHSGNVHVPAGIVRGGDNNDQNSVVVYDLQPYIGASPYFTLYWQMSNDLNNGNICPSNYFFIDAPAQDGNKDYENVQFRNFISGHVQEDWNIHIEDLLNNDTADGDGVLTYAAPYFGHAQTNVHGLHVIDARPGEPPYKLCGIATLPVRNVADASNKSCLKFIAYTFDRGDYPGVAFDDAHQFDVAILGGAAGQAAVFVKYSMESGYKEMDAVQVLYKANSTLNITNNALGIF